MNPPNKKLKTKTRKKRNKNINTELTTFQHYLCRIIIREESLIQVKTFLFNPYVTSKVSVRI